MVLKWTEFISGNEKTIGSKEAAEIKKDAMGEDKPETNGDKMEVDA